MVRSCAQRATAACCRAAEAAPAPVETKQEYLLRFTIEYDTAKAVIRPKYDAMMRKAAEFLLSSPDTVAEISGHTDSIGSEKYNMDLSLKRAIAVAHYMVTREGIDPKMLFVKGMGKTKLLSGNETTEGRRINRRFEILFLVPKGT